MISIPPSANYDIWAFGVVVYEAVAGHPLSAYACRGKRAMTSAEVGKIGLWDEYNLKKALKYIDDADENAKSLIKNLLHFDPEQRMSSMRKVLEHPFFASASSKSASEISLPEVNVVKNHVNSAPSSTKSTKERKSVSSSIPQVQSKPKSKQRTEEDFTPKIATTQSLSSSIPAGSQDQSSLNSPNNVPSQKSKVLDTSSEANSSIGSVTTSRTKKSKRMFESMRSRFGKKRQLFNA